MLAEMYSDFHSQFFKKKSRNRFLCKKPEPSAVFNENHSPYEYLWLLVWSHPCQSTPN